MIDQQILLLIYFTLTPFNYWITTYVITITTQLQWLSMNRDEGLKTGNSGGLPQEDDDVIGPSINQTS